MPRPERPLDESAGELARFAGGLRRLRELAGSPGYRELGLRAHFSASTLAEAAGGRRLPSLEVTLAYVRACGGDADEWERRWFELATDSVAAEEAATDERAPYVGLTSFGASDAEWFFGRDRLTERLVERVARQRFVAVLGASGSGKSSLLGAGLVAATRSGGLPGGLSGEDDWLVTTITPGTNPVVPHHEPGTTRLLVVDQFEEIFTLCHDEGERSRFVDALLVAAAEHTHVVIGVRTDFYTHCLDHPRLVDALQDAQFLVGPMSTEELRRAIVQPAVRAGCTVEGALVTELVAEAAGQPGTLPLVSHALLETFQRRRGNTLTLAGYQAAGGMRGAAARTAEGTFATLTEPQQTLAEGLFLRLTALGEGTEDTKRRVDLGELDASTDLDAVLDAYVRARLITVDGSVVEIAHEALIRSWPRLRGWLTEDRDGLRVHRQLTESTEIWESLDRDGGALYRGTRLAIAREWATNHDGRLGARERSFLQASMSAEGSERHRTQRRNRQLRWFAAALTVLLVAAVALSAIALGQRQEAVEQQRIAQSRQLAAQAKEFAQRDAGMAIRWALEAYAAHPTVEARSVLLSLASRPSYTARLARTSGPNRRVALSPNGRLLVSSDYRGAARLWDLTKRTSLGLLGGTQLAESYVDFEFDQGGEQLAAANQDGHLQVWDPTERTSLRAVAFENANADVVISADLSLAATADKDGRIRVRDTNNGAIVASWVSPGGVAPALAFSGHGRVLAVAGADGSVTVWQASNRTRRTYAGTEPLTAIALDGFGRNLATATVDGGITLRDLERDTPPVPLTGDAGRINGLAFHPNRPVLVSTGQDKRVTFWDAAQKMLLTQLETEETGLGIPTFDATGSTLAVPADEATLLWDREDLPLLGHRGAVRNVSFGPEGELHTVSTSELLYWNVDERVNVGSNAVLPFERAAFGAGDDWLVLGASDRTVHSLNLRNGVGATIAGLEFRNEVVAMSPTEPVVATSNANGSLSLWDIERAERVGEIPFVVTEDQSVASVAFTPDGRTIAVNHDDGILDLWDVRTSTKIDTLRTDFAPHMVFGPSGDTIALAVADGTVRVWDLRARRAVATFDGHAGKVTSIAFAGDGRMLATAGTDAKVVLWDLTTRTRWATLSGHTDQVTSVAWHPDGVRLATGAGDNSVTVWTADPDTAIGRLCRRLTKDFPTEAEPPPAICS